MGRRDAVQFQGELNFIQSKFESLTRREAEILHLLLRDFDNPGDRRAACSFAEQTVRNHVSVIYTKLGVGDRTPREARGQGRPAGPVGGTPVLRPPQRDSRTMAVREGGAYDRDPVAVMLTTKKDGALTPPQPRMTPAASAAGLGARMDRYKYFYILLLPAIVFYFVFNYVPHVRDRAGLQALPVQHAPSALGDLPLVSYVGQFMNMKWVGLQLVRDALGKTRLLACLQKHAAHSASTASCSDSRRPSSWRC